MKAGDAEKRGIIREIFSNRQMRMGPQVERLDFARGPHG